MAVRSEIELIHTIMPGLKDAVDYVVQKIWNDNRELVRTVVYEAYNPTTYERTNEFGEAWETESKYSSNVATGEFRYAPDKMSVGWPSTEYGTPQYGRHASAIDNFDARPYLADIIYGGLAGPAFGHGVTTGAWHKARNAWSALEKKLGKRYLAKLFEEGMSKNGISYHRHNKAIQHTVSK